MALTDLRTARLRLRLITPAILTDQFRNSNEADFRKVFDVDTAGYERYRGMVEKGMETDRISLLFFLLIETETGRTIGQCGFHNWNQFHDRAEVFYLLHHDADKGKGYMKEALETVLNYGFREMNLHRIEAFVKPGNVPSEKLLLHFGFRKEGTAKEHYLVDGVYEDSDSYGLLVTNWDGNAT